MIYNVKTVEELYHLQGNYFKIVENIFWHQNHFIAGKCGKNHTGSCAPLQEKENAVWAGFVDSGFLLCTENGKPYSLDYIYNIYNRFMKKVAVKHGLRYLYPHELRHTFASLALENHSDIKAVQETLGHNDATVTLNVYAHAYKKAKDRQAATIDNVLLGIAQG